MNKKYQVFISSTYKDLIEERKKVSECVLMSDCIPAGMEAFVAEDEEQFNIIKKVIDFCDYFILILGERYGSINKQTKLSYTEMEYDYAIKQKIPVLVMQKNIDYNSEEYNGYENIDQLRKFVTKVSSNRLVSIWKDKSELQIKTTTSLAKAKESHLRPGWERGSSKYSINEIYEQLNDLRIKNDKLEASNTQLSNNISIYKRQLSTYHDALNMHEKFNGKIKVGYYKEKTTEYNSKFLWLSLKKSKIENDYFEQELKIEKLYLDYASYNKQGKFNDKTYGIENFLKFYFDADSIKPSQVNQITQLFFAFGLISSGEYSYSNYVLTRVGEIKFNELLLKYLITEE